MNLTNEYIYKKMLYCQHLLWSGSETENIEAHNIISKLIKDMEDQKFVGANFDAYDQK
jgi:hypothetical protein